MEMLGFSDEEVAALAITESFGTIDADTSYYRDPRFSNKYYRNLLAFGKADKNVELGVDKFLLGGDRYKKSVKKFAEDKTRFHGDLREGIYKMHENWL